MLTDFPIAIRLWENHTAHLALPVAQAIETILPMVSPTLNILEIGHKTHGLCRLRELTTHSGHPRHAKCSPQSFNTFLSLSSTSPFTPFLQTSPDFEFDPHLSHRYICVHLTHIFFSNLTSSDSGSYETR